MLNNNELSPFKRNQKRFSGLSTQASSKSSSTNKNKSFDLSRGLAMSRQNSSANNTACKNSSVIDNLNEDSFFFNKTIDLRMPINGDNNEFTTMRKNNDNMCLLQSEVNQQDYIYNRSKNAVNYDTNSGVNRGNFFFQKPNETSGMKPDPPDTVFSPDIEFIKRKSIEIKRRNINKNNGAFLSPETFLQDNNEVDLGTNPFAGTQEFKEKFSINGYSVREFESDKKNANNEKLHFILNQKYESNFRNIKNIDEEESNFQKTFSSNKKITEHPKCEDLRCSDSSMEGISINAKIEEKANPSANFLLGKVYSKVDNSDHALYSNLTFNQENQLYKVFPVNNNSQRKPSSRDEEYEWKSTKRKDRRTKMMSDNLHDSKILEEARSKEKFEQRETIDLVMNSPNEKDIFNHFKIFRNSLMVDQASVRSYYLESKREEDLCETEDEKKFEAVNAKILELRKYEKPNNLKPKLVKNKSASSLGVGVYKGDLLAFLQERSRTRTISQDGGYNTNHLGTL
jgi:hypothetical protein